MKRPMLYWVSLFILGEVLTRVLPISVVVLCTIGATVLLTALCLQEKSPGFIKENRSILGLGVLFFVMGAGCMVNTRCMTEYCMEQTGTEVRFTGKITGLEASGRETCYIVAVRELTDSSAQRQYPFHMKLLVSSGEQEILPLGSRIQGKGRVREFSRAANPGGYDEQSYQYGRGVFLALQEAAVETVTLPQLPVRQFLYEIRKHLSQVYDTILSEGNAALAAAMVLGDKEGLDAEMKQLYQRNGIAHLIAISGLHIAMIGGTLYHFLRRLSGRYLVSAGIGIAFIFLYGMMTGMTGATMRAVVMLVISVGADVGGRRYDAVTSIALALLWMLLLNPYQITQAGFLLSFGAVIGIAVVNPVWKLFLPAMPRCLEGLFVSISVQLVLLPVLLYYFYEIPLYGVLLNVIVVPLMSILLFVLIAGGLVGCFWMSGARLISLPARFIFGLYAWLCHASECLPFHTVCTGRPDMRWIAGYYMIIAAFLLVVYSREEASAIGRYCKKRCKRIKLYQKLILAGVGTAYVLQFAVFCLPTALTFCMLDVGQGDGIYIRTPLRHHILMDGGSSSKQKVGTYVLKNSAKFYGAGRLDYVFVSHSDSDHYSGILELLEDDTVSVDNFVLPDITNPDESYRRLEQTAMEQGCRLYYMKRGDMLQIDGITFTCLNPETRDYADKNTGSLVLKLSYRNFDALLTGDMDKLVEECILADMDGETIEFLKVAHHGSATASSEVFLKVVRPEVACVSVGEGNRYGHPAAEVMERLSVYAEKIYLTKDSGAITIDTDGRKYWVTPFLTN